MVLLVANIADKIPFGKDCVFDKKEKSLLGGDNVSNISPSAHHLYDSHCRHVRPQLRHPEEVQKFLH